ncbi:MAG: S8 family serine peptidase [Candidatus Thorarchaeota archaeon]|nr:S8 family serine peptidase [Candidatus Thorarchaeota archaeon]
MTSMIHAWEIENVPRKTEKSGTLKGIAILIVLIILASTLTAILAPELPNIIGSQKDGVRVAVIDTGVNADELPFGSVVASKSFILPQYGYDVADTSTADSEPERVPHGTLVSNTILSSSTSAVIVNAKTISDEGSATSAAIVAAIYWAIEENCSVINLSLGSSPTLGDPMRDAINYAVNHGVVVVSSAGNEGDSGTAGSSVGAPALFENVIAVGALDELGKPAQYSSTGPTREPIMKPDIMATGYVSTSSAIYYGTSFSSPRIAGRVADLIKYCKDHGIAYTPGLIKAALMKSATRMAYPEYVVGAGKVNYTKALQIIGSFSQSSEVPALTYVHPKQLPIDYERLFYNDNYSFGVQIINSKHMQYTVDITTTTPSVFHMPSTVEVNQTAIIPLEIHVPSSGPTIFAANITFASGVSTDYLQISFTAAEASAHVALDVSRSAWSIDTHYGQFREFYKLLVKNSISVTEFAQGTTITENLLNRYDAVLILDPCTWGTNETDPLHPKAYSLRYTQDEIRAYESYFNNSGGIFVAGLDNKSINVSAVNELLSWSGFALGTHRIPSSGDAVKVINLTIHSITAGVTGFDFVGANLTLPENATSLATYKSVVTLGAMERSGGGRLVVTGTNFFIDNWGLSGKYEANGDKTIALQIVLWLMNKL